MHGDSSQLPNTRVERLLKQRELQRTKDHDSSTSTTTTSADGDSLEGREPPLGETKRQRLLVVANRLPVTAKREGEESWSLEISPGGLVSALIGVKEFEARYIGWPGISVPDEVGQRSLTTALVEKKCIPVFLDKEIVDQYYNGYCNKILWPLLHYLGLPGQGDLDTTKSFQSKFESYKTANQKFSDVVNQHYEEGDVVWCHDYHLMFLPEKLKECNSKMKVGWFLHTPFPSSEVYRTLPTRVELLRAVLAADLVGFHTYDYARHFVSSCTRVLGLEGTPEGVEDQGRLTRVAACPIGIDPQRFMRGLETPEVEIRIKKLKKEYSGKKIILGVDRLDMIKGIPQKIIAFEKYLEENPDCRDKVVLLQIAVPSRTDVPEYQKLASQVHVNVGRINGKFGSLNGFPILHLDQSRDFYDLCALYSVADVALVTSLRDGMNLVSYEFVACQDSKKGVLILSEFAGAAQSLGAGAILVNPWNITEIAAAIGKALSMPAEEREKRHRHNFEHINAHTSQKWAELFVSELNDTVIEAQKRIREVPPQLVVRDAVSRYLMCKSRLLVLGFNGVLTEAIDAPGRRGGDQIREMELKLHPDVKEPLKRLCRDPNTTIVVLSGSRRSLLDDIFKEYDLWLACENGMFLRSPTREWITKKPELSNMDWVDSVKNVFGYFTERTPRSFFEHRETSLIWNYKYSDVAFGRIQARDMLEHLWTGPISNSPVDIVRGSRSVEVRAVGVSKGAAMKRILTEIDSKTSGKPINYVLCLGHFLEKDEDIYTYFDGKVCSPEKRKDNIQRERNHKKRKSGGGKVIKLAEENYFSCAVGRSRTRARYLLSSTDDVVALLKQMATPSQPSNPSA